MQHSLYVVCFTYIHVSGRDVATTTAAVDPTTTSVVTCTT